MSQFFADRRNSSPFRRRFAFEVQRIGAVSQVRRVLVYARDLCSAREGVGRFRDESIVQVPLGFSDAMILGSGLSVREQADLFRKLGKCLQNGQSLRVALNLAARQSTKPQVRGILGELSQRLVQGEDLPRAMDALGGVFSPTQCTLASVATLGGLEEAGKLFCRLADRLGQDARLGARLLAALAYPFLLLGLTLASALVLELKALPPMVELFRSMGARLPPVTQAFYDLSGVLLETLPFWLLGLLLALGVSLTSGREWLLRPRVQAMLSRLWALGPLLKVRALSRALSTYALLCRCGVGNKVALEQAGAVAGNQLVADFFLQLQMAVCAGVPMEVALHKERDRLGSYGENLAGLIELGLQGGDIPNLLDTYVAELDEEAENRVVLLPRLLELPLLAFCGLVVGVLILAIFLPYPSLLGDLARNLRGGS